MQKKGGFDPARFSGTMGVQSVADPPPRMMSLRRRSARTCRLLAAAGLRKVARAEDFDTAEIVPQFDVDDARHRVGTVNRRLAAGENVDRLDHAERNEAEIGLNRRTPHPRQAETFVIHHHKHPLRAEPAQSDVGRA